MTDLIKIEDNDFSEIYNININKQEIVTKDNKINTNELNAYINLFNELDDIFLYNTNFQSSYNYIKNEILHNTSPNLIDINLSLLKLIKDINLNFITLIHLNKFKDFQSFEEFTSQNIYYLINKTNILCEELYKLKGGIYGKRY